MTDQLDTTLIAAGITQLRADAQLTVFDGVVPNGSVRPYVLVYGFVEWPQEADSNALDGLSRTAMVRWICHCAGDTRESATAVAQRVRTQMRDTLLAPIVSPAAVFGLIKQEQSLQPERDESTGVSVFDAICTYVARVTI